MDSDQAEQRLERMFQDHSGQVYAYAFHRLDPDAAKDVVGETFLVAWRRISEVPEPPLPWLLTTARNHIANEVRRRSRSVGLTERLKASHPRESMIPAIVDRGEAAAALEGLSENDREILVLSAWCDLTNGEAARVLGCSTATYAVRLHRARRRFKEHFEQQSGRVASYQQG